MSNAVKTEVIKTKVQTYDSGKRGEIEEHIYKPKLWSIQIMQKITTLSYYPAVKLNNNFTNISFGQEVKDLEPYENTETRVTWIDVAKENFEGKSKSEVLALFQKYLESKPDACIYKILSTEPIFTEGQLQGIAAGLTTKDIIADRQLVRYSDNYDKEELRGMPIEWNGLKQYKSNYFSEIAVADMDLRKIPTVLIGNTIEQEEDITIGDLILN